jgi:hypothetical protein
LSLKIRKLFETWNKLDFSENTVLYSGTVKKVGAGARAGAGVEIFDNLEPEPHKNGPAPQR